MRIASKLCCALVVIGLGSVTRVAGAVERFGGAGAFAVSGERLTGFVFASDKSEQEGITTTVNRTTISFLGSAYAGAVNVYSLPRIAFDFFPINGLSLGGSLALISLSSKTKSESQGVSVERDEGSIFGFLFSPRVGYAAMFSPKVGIWPRGGITYWSTKTSPGDSSNDSSATMSRIALTIEAPLVISPVPHTAIYVGPTLDLGLGGSNKTTTDLGATSTESSVDHTGTDIGVQAGLGLYF